MDKEAQRKYIKLMRKYNKTYPAKSLKVNVRIVRSALKPEGETDKKEGTMSYMESVSSVLGEEVSDDAALDAWLAKHNGDGDGLFVLGDISGAGSLNFIVDDAPIDNASPAPQLQESAPVATFLR